MGATTNNEIPALETVYGQQPSSPGDIAQKKTRDKTQLLLSSNESTLNYLMYHHGESDGRFLAAIAR